MKKFTLFASLASYLVLAFAGSALAVSPDFDIKKVDVAFINSPEYQVTPPIHQSRSQKWMEIEVTFEAKPELTDELTFNYYVLFNKRLLVGRVNHVAIQKDRELRSVAYISPKAIAQILKGKAVSPADIENVSVTITKPGISAPLSSKSWKPSTGEWWATLKAEEGYVLNKSETPFAPLFWDRYEALKSGATR